MAVTTEISWGDGTSDKIYLTRNASEGNQTVSVSSDANTGAARSKTVSFSTGGITRVLTVSQEAGGPQRYTITVYPSSLDAALSVYDSIDSSHPIDNAFTASSSSTYARVYWVYGNSQHTWVYLNFDLSQIPLDATIISVSCSLRQAMTGTQSTRWLVREAALTSGTTIKSEVITPSMNKATTLTDAGTWTATELRDAKWMTHIQRRNYGTTEYHCDFYGASLTITYEV